MCMQIQSRHTQTPLLHFLSLEMDMYSPGNPNPNPNPSFKSGNFDDGVLDAIKNILFEDDFDYVIGEDQSPQLSPVLLPIEEFSNHIIDHYHDHDPSLADHLLIYDGDGDHNFSNVNMSTNDVIKNEERKAKRDAQKPQRVAFKTKTKLDVLDDGYRWRKYGKKAVKNSPNPRNYYKCLSEGCKVKKIVERWVEDSSYVITQYDGVHNHESSSAYFYNNNTST